MRTSWAAATALVVKRDLVLAFRRFGQIVQPLAFFAVVATLFPLALSPEMSRLRDVAPGVLWVSALLSSLLALEYLFRDDAQDGTLEQLALSGQPLTMLLLAKTLTAVYAKPIAAHEIPDRFLRAALSFAHLACASDKRGFVRHPNIIAQQNPLPDRGRGQGEGGARKEEELCGARA